MSINQSDWELKIKSWLPDWFYLEKPLETSFIKALAKILTSAEIDLRDQIAQTFINTAVGSYLDLHGEERSVLRKSKEYDSSYRKRIKVTSTRPNDNIVNLKDLIDSILIKGKCAIQNDFDNDLFFDRNQFLNRGAVAISKISNTFSIVIDLQKHDPFSFLNREFFLNSEDFVGHISSSDEYYNFIVEVINENKALGTLYRLIERTG